LVAETLKNKYLSAPLVAIASNRFTDPSITFHDVEPERPMPFPDANFDVVFTKDAWLHVLDKPALLREVHRVLKPGGQLAGGDWMKGPEPFSADMLYFIELEGIPYHPATLAEYGLMLHEIGFENVRLQDLNAWYRELGRQEYARMKGELFDLMTEKLGTKVRDHYLEDWRMLTVVLDKGELRPGRLWATKPA
jgi:phosphoethanolamine N-methyltransferase